MTKRLLERKTEIKQNNDERIPFLLRFASVKEYQEDIFIPDTLYGDRSTFFATGNRQDYASDDS